MNRHPITPRLQLVKSIPARLPARPAPVGRANWPLLIPPPKPRQTKTAHRPVGRGMLWGWRLNHPKPLTIKLASGVSFCCGGLTRAQQVQLLDDNQLGRQVEFFYDRISPSGQPVNPTFKTLVLRGMDGGRS